jgi:predicted PhzF superfamily epimerase YddE/YHI9
LVSVVPEAFFQHPGRSGIIGRRDALHEPRGHRKPGRAQGNFNLACHAKAVMFATNPVVISNMRIPYYEVAAFAAQPFSGNPAAVCALDQWLPDALLQAIAAENNLSETAFFVREGDGFRLRWFTPAVEVDLCGHATLATAFVLFTELGHGEPVIRFQTQSGPLAASRRQELVELVRALQRQPREVQRARDYLVVFDSQADVMALQPDMNLLTKLDCLGVIATARGDEADFVSRFFAPAVGVPEDPVTGSAHSTLIPFWAERLGKTELVARQVSKRGGTLYCRHLGRRVAIGGRAVVYCRGDLEVPTA